MRADRVAKDGPPMFFEKPAPPVSDSAAARSLAVGVLELCSLCEDLLSLAAAHQAAPIDLDAFSEQLDAVRASALPLLKHSTPEADNDPYSAAALGRWVWRE
jgi:hypothetical protein